MTESIHPPGDTLRVVLLDIDGTLIDSNDAHARAWVQALKVHGYVVAFAQVRPLIGMGGDNLLPALVGLDPKSDEAKRIAETRGELFRRELPALRPTNGARDLLTQLQHADLELVVATSAEEQEVTAILEQAGVADLLHLRASSDDAEHSKPDPDIVLAALRKTGRHASQSIMIGDTPYDIESATGARVPVIALRCGGWWTDDDLRGAIAIYNDPAELCRSIARSPFRGRG